MELGKLAEPQNWVFQVSVRQLVTKLAFIYKLVIPWLCSFVYVGFVGDVIDSSSVSTPEDLLHSWGISRIYCFALFCVYGLLPLEDFVVSYEFKRGNMTKIGEGSGNPLQYSCLENSMDRGALWAISMGSQRVRHNWVHTHTHTYTHGWQKYKTIPDFLEKSPGVQWQTFKQMS